MLLAGLFLRYQLIRQQNDKQYQVTQLTRKLADLQKYSSAIGDGKVSMFDMMNMPSSLMGRGMAFMAYSQNMAMQGAQQNLAMMGPQIQMQMQGMQNPQQQQMYQQWIMKNLYEQQLKDFSKKEEKLLNAQEQEIQQEKTKAETELKMITAQLESISKHTDEAASQWKANYA